MEGSVNVLAFCPLLWQDNKGPVDERNNPLIQESQGIRGNCTKPYDCATCPVMQRTLTALQGEIGLWVCPDCASKIPAVARHYQIKIEFAGYYMEGYCQRPSCEREGRYSPLLQLLLVVGDAIP